MWVLALLGTITKTAEITLAVHYRDIDEDGRIRGGPMYYIRRGLGWPALATLFSLGVFVNALCSATLLQGHTVGRSFLASYGTSPYLVTAVMTVVTGVVVIGGVRKGIERASKILMPLLLVLLLLMMVVALSGKGAAAGISFLFKPDFGKLTPQRVESILKSYRNGS